MGAGTMLVAAALLERRWLGCDILEDAFAATIEQLKTVAQQNQIQAAEEAVLEAQPILDVADREKIRPLVDQLLARDAPDATSVLEYGAVVSDEEDRITEFKTVTGQNPVATISSTADRYAVSFLNSEGGSIYWGIADDRTVLGVPLTSHRRDEIRQALNNKLANIHPAILPDAFRVNFHRVANPPTEVESYVVELRVPTITQRSYLFSTGGDEVFLRVDGVTRKLTTLQVQDWARRAEQARLLVAQAHL
jgi:hypothetical protein